MRKKEYSSISRRRQGDNTKSISWHKGKRTVKKSFTKIDKNGELYTIETQRSFNFFGLLKIIAILLLLSTLMNVFMGSHEKTFEGLLLMLQDVPEIFPLDNMVDYFTLTDYSKIPDWLGGLVDFFKSFLTLGAFILKGIFSVLALIFYFLKWLFI